MSNNKMLVALLGVVAVLLAVIAGLLIFKSPSSSVPDATTTAPVTANPTAPGTTAPVTAPTGPFDPAKATKVPVGVKPDVFVENYFKAIIKNDWNTAYAMLPMDKKASYGTAASFGQQLASYKATGYKMGPTTVKGNDTEVQATLNTPGGNFGYTWTLEKYKGGFVVKSRTLTGMGN
jgi:hypothetical protein